MARALLTGGAMSIRKAARFAAPMLLLAAGYGCTASSTPEDAGVDGPEPSGNSGDAVVNGSVAQAMATSCSTASVKGLSQQIIDEASCINGTAFTALPDDRANLVLSDNVNGYLEAPARDALVASLDARPNDTLHIDSMLRTVAQQYLLYQWYLNGRCGIPLAAKPGNSNHETGLAFDTPDYALWKSTLQGHGFKWFGSSDKEHYDYAGQGAKSFKGTDVLAFQRLWNRNNPNDTIGEDGSYGPQTEARLKKSPAQGFDTGPICGGSSSSSSSSGGTSSSSSASSSSSGGGQCNGPTDFQCAPDGMSRSQCDVNGNLVVDQCPNGCLIQAAGDICMGTTTSWSCPGLYGKTKAQNGDYFATEFGCWTDANGGTHTDPGDNCIPGCLADAQKSICAGMSGPECEESVNWYAADAGRFGCMAHLKVTNPANGKSVVVVALDYGPGCSVESKVSHAAIDLSMPAEKILFGGATGIVDQANVHVIEVDPSTPLGPAN